MLTELDPGAFVHLGENKFSSTMKKFQLRLLFYRTCEQDIPSRGREEKISLSYNSRIGLIIDFDSVLPADSRQIVS